MQICKHVSVSVNHLTMWAEQLTDGERFSLGDGSPLECYVNYIAALGWRLVAMSQLRGPGFQPLVIDLILSGDSPANPYPDHGFRPVRHNATV